MGSLQRSLAKRVLSWAFGQLDQKTINRLMVSTTASPTPGTSSVGLSLAESQRIGVADAPLPVMRYPAPYLCALAINNDVDGLTYPVFRGIHDFVNGCGETPLGEGLRLEMADSFWVWSHQGYVSLLHGHPSQANLPPSPEAEELVTLNQSGYLDTLHGFGEWSDDYTLPRERIGWALDHMAALGLKPSVYTAHGGYNMRHNVGGPWGYYQEADLPESPSYCLDLLAAFGFRYYWSDVFYDLDKYGDYQCLDSGAALNSAYLAYQPDLVKYYTAPSPTDYAQTRNVWATLPQAEQARLSTALFNQNPVQVTARDGRPVWMFKRFRGHDGPNSGNFVQQVNAERLDSLERTQGAVVIYQHFGVWRAMGMGKGHVSQKSFEATEPVMDPHTVWAFRELAQRHHAGRVWVTTTERLLRYLWMRDHLTFRVERGTDKVLIHLGPLLVSGEESARQPTLTEVQGFGVRIPRDWPETVFVLGSSQIVAQRQPASTHHAETHSEMSEDTLSIPWQPLQYPF
jgi:hypothetical protein